MIIIVAALLAILSVPLTGKSLVPLAHLTIRRSWVLWASTLLQLLITLVPGFPATVGEAVHLFTFFLAAVFVWSNRQIPGELVIAAGGALNLAAILANGGTMPASEWAWRTAGFAPPSESFGNSSIVESARLPWLGDVFAVPESWPFSNVFGLGDVVIIVGLTYLVHHTCRRVDAVAGLAAPSLVTALSARVVLQELGDDMRLLRDHCHQLTMALGAVQELLRSTDAETPGTKPTATDEMMVANYDVVGDAWKPRPFVELTR